MDIKQLELYKKHADAMINDLALSLEMWLNGYPFDHDHIVKQRAMVDNAHRMIGRRAASTKTRIETEGVCAL